MYRAFLFLHILCAVVGFGAVIIASPALSRAVRIGGEAGHAVFSSAKRQVMIAQPFIWLVFIFGLVIVFTSGHLDISAPWLSASMALFILMILISLVVLMPATNHMEKLFEAETAENSAELDKLGKRLAAVGGVNHLIFVVILALMIWKP